ncbi:MAG: PilZ domain-containing protein [Myxococcota bacterium]
MVRFRVAFLARGQTQETEPGRKTFEGTGRVINISKTGALIEGVDQPVPAGSRIKLRFSFLEDSVPVEVPALVMRETEGGFAVEFKKLSLRTRAVLGVAIAKLRASEDDYRAEDDITLLKS